MLLTGASGLIGSAIATRLQSSAELLCCGRKISAGVSIGLDLGTPAAEQILDGIARCDFIVHAAAAIDYSPHQVAISRVNALGTHQLVALAARWGAGMVYLSSVPVIGQVLHTPIDESHPVAPRTAYHASKWYGEQLLALHARSSGLPAISLRLPAPIGPGSPRGRIASEFVHAAIERRTLRLAGTGSRRQSYLDVRDIAIAVEQSLYSGKTGMFLIGPERSVANRDLAARCGSALGIEVQIEYSGQTDPEDAIDWQLDCTAATRAFGFAPQFTLERSLHDMALACGWSP